MKYKSILSSEESWAKSVVRSVIKPKQISVWEFLIPIIFIMNWMKDTQRREIFVENLMFTKKLAIEAAFDIVQHNKRKDEALGEIRGKTDRILQSEQVRGIYSENIQRRQLEEVDLLIDHYQRLLHAEGSDYESLVVNTYKDMRAYLSFLDTLKRVEKDVTLAAQETVGEKADKDMASRMKKASDSFRSAKAEKIFKQT